jgi:hypothetical protein
MLDISHTVKYYANIWLGPCSKILSSRLLSVRSARRGKEGYERAVKAI